MPCSDWLPTAKSCENGWSSCTLAIGIFVYNAIETTMKEISAIIEAYDRAQAAGHRSALVTVVHVDGSFYRRPGARMLVTDEGACTGAISGGCLEGDALRKALLAISSGEPRLVTYDTSDEEDASIGVQLGCSGIIQVLFEPIDAEKDWNPMRLLRAVVKQKTSAALVTIFNIKDPRGPQVGAVGAGSDAGFWMLDSELSCADPLIEDNLRVLAKLALGSGTSTFTEIELEKNPASRIQHSESVVAFVQVIPRPLPLVIVGAGNDAIPLARFADVLGWEVTVIDGRSSHARSERFVPGCQVIVSKPEAALANISITERTAFVLMTHNYHYDLAMLKALLGTSTPYIGMLGPAKKRDRMLDDLKVQGVLVTEEDKIRIFGPAGLETGAESPEEIALSIAAEVQTALAGRPGGHLRDRSASIHDREETRIKTLLKS